MMKIYNTLSEKKEKITRRNKKTLKMFVCGPTVYDYAHIGHARSYIVFDSIVRYLRHKKFEVFYLQNITDVDDKIIERAGKDSRLRGNDNVGNGNPRLLARFFEKEYLKDMKTLGVTGVNKYARASQHIKEIKGQIAILLKKSFAYQTDSGIYFEVKKFPRYGRLSKQNLNKLRSGWRIEPDPQKKDPLDFALWKFTKKGGKTHLSKNTLEWNSPWGKGRPGWHIEDTAISEKYLGKQYDLHGAAIDLKFPHHEAEIAQQESISGKKPFVKIWMHAGFLLVNGEKMSKSLGNFITIKDFLKKYSANVLRFIILSHHYRSPINYTKQIAESHQAALQKINDFLRTISPSTSPDKRKTEALIKSTDKLFLKALDDDFNTPKALATIFSFIASAPKNIKAKRWVIEKLAILGINLKLTKIPIKIKKMIASREELRQKKNFKLADKIRNQIQKLGFIIED